MPTQKQIVEALMNPEAYDESSGVIELIQTHISFVFLTKNFVYKMKKAVNFGFLDFSTLEKRQFFCEKELELNRRLCPDMYLEVVPINESNVVKIKGKGKPVEYAVKMKRLPQGKILSKLLEENKVDNTLIERIAKIIADFHAKAETNQRISEFGALKIIKTNWDENFDQTSEYIGKTISARDFKAIRETVEKFMAGNSTVFEKRIKENRVKDCHGDIHSGNIFAADKVYIFDAIEFNERFRYSDVAADVAFLAMDLDFRGRHDLSDFFVEEYIKYSSDRELTKLLPFYECYRAYVRGKVVGFRLKDPNIDDHGKLVAINEAEAYFNLATVYAKTL